MENQLFECRIRYEKMMDNGMEKKVVESYLVEAVSFTEAEKRIIDEMTPFIKGEFEVASVMRRHYAEIFKDENAFSWYKAKLVMVTLDEKTGAEKKSSFNVLIQADDFDGARKRLEEGMKGSMMDYTIYSISETPYLDFYFFCP